MLKLIRMDIILNRRILIFMLALVFIYCAWAASVISSPRAYIVIVSLLVGLILPNTIQTREDRFKTAALSCSLPLRRSTVILGKYLTAWILFPVGLGFAFLIAAVFPLTKIDIAQILNLRAILVSLFLISLFFSILLPFIIRFGFVGVIIFLVAGQVLGLVFQMLAISIKNKDNVLRQMLGAVARGLRELVSHEGTPGFLLLLAGGIILLNVLSLKISQALYARRNF
jgi:hypothetical protein